METIIVTVTDEKGRFSEDLEVPVGLEAQKLKEDIVQTLEGWRPELCLDSFRLELKAGRSGRILQKNETLEEAGVWNGGYLILASAETAGRQTRETGR